MPVPKKISLIVREDPELLNNKIFSGQALYGMKSDNYPFIALRQRLNDIGIQMDTQDLLPPQNADLILCLDQVPLFEKLNIRNVPAYLIISEPPVYCPENWDKKKHTHFKKVFTYDDNLCNDDRYCHYYFPVEFEKYSPFQNFTESIFKKRKFCILIAGAFHLAKPKSSSPSLLYERYNAVKWFSKNQPDDLDLYGRNLENKNFTDFRGSYFLQRLRLNFIARLISAQYRKIFHRVYRGSIPPAEKITYQEGYNFSICYENSKGVNGCISERIFDCFAALNVPVYLGAPDIDKKIPKECFIDKRDFPTYDNLYKYLKQMRFNEYNNYIEAIKKFMNSNEKQKFTVKNYTSTILSTILENHV